MVKRGRVNVVKKISYVNFISKQKISIYSTDAIVTKH